MRKRSKGFAITCTGAIFLLGSFASWGENFYEGKTIRFVVGFSPGGGFDTYTRAIARHIGGHIPGNPSTLVINMTGAGSLIAANYTYNKAKPDGLTIGHFIGGLILGQALGRPGIQFDAAKFEWIGAPAKLEAVCAFMKPSGIENLDDWMNAEKPPKLGATGPGSETYDVPMVLKAALGLPIQVVSGYEGTARIRLAIEAGELDGTCWGWEAMKVTWRRAIESGQVAVVLQATPEPHRDLPQVPRAITLAKSAESRRLIEVGIHDLSAILRPYALPPGTPEDHVRTLREGFTKTMQDPEFLAEARRSGLAIAPTTGTALAKIISGLGNLEPSLRQKLKDLLVPKN